MEYGTNVGFTAYHTARGRTVEIYDADDITAARLIASEWIDARYRSSFGGLKVGMRAQMREWPRTGAYDVNRYNIAFDVVPVEIENATYEAALRQLVAPGSLSVDWTPNAYKRASVDGAVSVEFATFMNASDIQTRFKIIDEILAPILTGCGSVAPLTGGSFRA